VAINDALHGRQSDKDFGEHSAAGSDDSSGMNVGYRASEA